MSTGGAFEAQAMTPQEHHQAAAAQAAATGWKSPVPYLFGGLAAMLGLIAFALLILACSYWKLSGYVDSAAGDSDGAAADEKPKEAKSVFLNSVLVIMPGDEKPTQLATPATSRASSFGDGSQASCSCGRREAGEEEGRREKDVEMGPVGGGTRGSTDGGGDENTTSTTTTSKTLIPRHA
ncbi:hypothetical protein Cgig2_033106 [Carnegiea gigantea]|uniref:Uncharacterized protein n=1 Tax=Carnegiea gigantea TaxID=171969 RepID=A0A9Q1K1A6_9CARY|nr:hypothetical protein Cgig2_033106 [Carnegiea gigantea]